MGAVLSADEYYSSLLGSSQRANELAGWRSRGNPNRGITQQCVFCAWSVPKVYKRHGKSLRAPPRRCGVEYLRLTLRVVGDDEKGSLRSESVKYGRESQVTRTRERLRW
jgi:hypothetical protein